MTYNIILLVLLLIFLVSLCIGIYLLWPDIQRHLQKRIIEMVQKIPGPPEVPLLGSIVRFVGTQEEQWTSLRQLAKQHPRIFKIWALNMVAIFIQTPDDIEIVLSSTNNLEKSEAYTLLKPWLGTGLLISSGNKWKLRRRLLTPAFHFNILRNFIDAFQKQNDYSISKILNDHLDKEVDILPIVTEHALFSLCDTTMGISIDPKNAEIKTYKKAIHDFARYFADRVVKPWYYIDFIYFYFMSVGRECRKTIKILQQFTTKILKERLENWNDNKYAEITGEYSTIGKQKLPMMDLLIKQMKGGADIDYDGIREEVDTFTFEGHDTTSIGLTFTLMLLANNPHVQEKILEEQIRVLDDLKKVVTFHDLQNMHYLERCIKESLRMYPPVPIIGRTTDVDITLDTLTIPAGIHLYVLIYDLHRNPKYWPEPEKFNPDRFLPENFTNHHPFSYIPFSAGSRNCIGQRFVMLEMKSFISQIIREFTLQPVDTPETVQIKMDLVLRPSKPVKVIFRKRK